MIDTPQLLLAHHLKALKLPTFLREYDKLAQQCAAEGIDHPRYLLRLSELELIDRERRMVERRIKEARFPTVKSLDSFDFTAIPSLNKTLVLELARCEYVTRRDNVIAVGNSGTGKTHIALGLGLAACQKGLSVGFTTAAAMVHGLIEARDEKRLLRLQRQLAGYKLLIVDELGYVPLSTTGAELLFEVFSQRYERGSTIVTSNLPFDEWTGVFGSPNTARSTIAERLLPRIRVIDAAHPLFGQPLEVSPSGLIRRIGWIRVVLPDGRHRWVPQKATDLNVSACEARPNRDLPLVSVRTLIPLAEYVRARLSALGERFDETSGHTADPAVRAGIAGSTADLGAEIVADDDADNTTTAGEAGGTATPVNAGRSRRRRFDRGASR